MDKKESPGKNQQPGYETRDVNVRSIAKFGFAIIVLALIAHFLMWLAFDFFAKEAKQRDPVLSPLAPKQMQVPPQPRLQAEVVGDDRGNPPFDSLTLKNRIAEEELQILNSYGWVDKTSGIVRIPIDQAMKLMSDKTKNEQK